jgi:tetratricopeptide (TPR) repeat protein
VTRLRFLVFLLLATAGLVLGQGKKAQPSKEQAPPEEDESLVPEVKEYSFNPLQAEKELKIGNYYFKKKSWKAAARRFEEATKWNPTWAEAFLRLAESKEKLNDPQAAHLAYAKFVDLAPDDKRAPQIKKRKLSAHR